MQFTEITNGQTLTASDYDRLECCGRLAQVAHASENFDVPGAVCATCCCTVASQPGYGAANVLHCSQHMN